MDDACYKSQSVDAIKYDEMRCAMQRNWALSEHSCFLQSPTYSRRLCQWCFSFVAGGLVGVRLSRRVSSSGSAQIHSALFLVNVPCSSPQRRDYFALGLQCDVGAHTAKLSVEAFSLRLRGGAQVERIGDFASLLFPSTRLNSTLAGLSKKIGKFSPATLYRENLAVTGLENPQCANHLSEFALCGLTWNCHHPALDSKGKDEPGRAHVAKSLPDQARTLRS
jgi:hypothetical protein